MKIFYSSLKLLSFVIIITGCTGKGPAKNDSQSLNDKVSVPDTGFTGIKQYKSGQYLIKEITFENGVREGLMKSFYQDGRLRMTYWYANGLKEDSSKWYYPEGQLFRSTPYKRDTIDGTQKQYFRDGKLKAKLNYAKGFRTPYLEEFTRNGKLVNDYPEMVINISDNYTSNGRYRVALSLSNKATKVRFYRGEFSNGVFDTTLCIRLNTINGIGNLDLRKTGSPTKEYVGVIAEILTNYGNNYLLYKKIDLPYKDLN